MVSSYDDNNLPLDVVWLDIPYMKDFADFTVDKEAFPDLKGLADSLHQNYRKIVPILDGGISAEDKFNNKYYQLATVSKTLIKTTINKDNGYSDALISKVWPNRVAFMDWFSDKAQDVWAEGLNDLYSEFPYDGLWLDMNEATTFVDGEYSRDELKGD